MNINTGRISLKSARSDETEIWMGGFALPNGQIMPLVAHVDNNGYRVMMKDKEFKTTLREFTIPFFGEFDIQVVRTSKATLRCSRDVNRIDIAVLAR